MKKLVSLLLALMLCLGGLSALAEEDAGIYPLETDVTLTWWLSASADLTGEQQDRNNNEIMQWLQEAVGVDIEFVSPAIGEEQTAFTLMCATGDLYDIISYNPGSYTGGLQAAIDDGIALVLNDYLDTYLPNFQRYLEEYPSVALSMQSVNGQYAYFPCLSLKDSIVCWFGPQIRADWLEEQNLEAPVTIEDWYTTLKTLKEAYGLEAGMALQTGAWTQGEMAGAWRTALDWDITDEGEVEYGPATEKYRAFLEEMHKWYEEGILHPDISTMDNTTAKALYSSGKVAAVMDSSGAMTNFLAAATDPDFATMGCTYPVLEEGQTPNRGYRNVGGYSPNTFINANIPEEKLEVALRVLDYGYSEEGQVLYNFGKEGVSFEYVDGVPTYTDLILNNPDGMGSRVAIERYTRASGFPGEQMEEYYTQINSLDCQKQAFANWSNTEQAKHAFPATATGTIEQAERMALLQTDINTYVEEMRFQFIMGSADLASFDDYLAELDNMGFQELLELKKAAYADYLARLEG